MAGFTATLRGDLPSAGDDLYPGFMRQPAKVEINSMQIGAVVGFSLMPRNTPIPLLLAVSQCGNVVRKPYVTLNAIFCSN